VGRGKFKLLCVICGVLLIMNGYRIDINNINARHDSEIKSIQTTHKAELDKLNKERQELIKKVNELNKENESIKQQQSDVNPQSPLKSSTISRGGSFVYMGKMRATAYSLSVSDCEKTPDDPAYGITTSGKYAEAWHTVAMSRDIPFGTRVYIPYFGDGPNGGIFVCEDRGGAIHGNRIDIFMDSSADCNQFGVRYLDVYVVK